MKLDIVMVNYHADEGMLKKCLSSIASSESEFAQVARVIVVDNGGSGALPPCFLPASVYVQGQNLGFAKACNLGANKGDSPYILFLNPDVALHKNALDIATGAIDGDESVGVLGIDLVDERGDPSPSRMNFPSFWHLVLPRRFCSHFEPGVSGYCQAVLGAFFLVRRSAFERCTFDENFFLYYEEIDLCRRLCALGYKTCFESTAHATHLGGGCSDRSVTAAYSANSRVLYAKKYLPPAKAWLAEQIIRKLEPTVRKVYRKIEGRHAKNSGF